MAKIRVDYDALRVASKAVATRSTALKTVISGLSARAIALDSVWDGVAEQTWFAELASCQQRMAKTPDMLDELSRDLLETAAIFEQAEIDARAMIAATVVADG